MIVDEDNSAIIISLTLKIRFSFKLHVLNEAGIVVGTKPRPSVILD